MTNTVDPIISAIGDALGDVLGWVGTVIGSLTGSSGALNPLLPVFAITVGVSLVLLGISIVRKLCYGA